jgi:hypothetical protein
LKPLPKAAAGRCSWTLLRAALACLVAIPTAGACAHRAATPTAEATQQRPINLNGIKVMVLPAQPTASTPESVVRAFDAELAYWLNERAPRVRWIPATELERLAQSSPALRLDLHALDVRAFGRMRVRRIGDPLFGDVHNLGAVVEARLALLPATVAYVMPSGQPAGNTAGRIEVTGALIETFSGDIIWYGVVAGDPGPIDAPAAAASAAQALARALTPGN